MDFIDQFTNIKFYLIGSYPKGDVGGLLLNIILALSAIGLSFAAGALLGYSRLSCRLYIKLPSMAFIEIVRATPLIMIIFWIYFFLPYLFGGNVTVFWSAVVSLSIYAAAYQSEIVRAGIIAVPRGQLEAALSTGMSRYKAMRHVILPQAFRIMVPSFVSFFVSLFKDTATVFIIGIIELTQAGPTWPEDLKKELECSTLNPSGPMHAGTNSCSCPKRRRQAKAWSRRYVVPLKKPDKGLPVPNGVQPVYQQQAQIF
jgi:polar amino acid transport system permease protein